MKPRLAVLALTLLGCAGPQPGDIPPIRYGVDACARCGMILSEERFAAGYVDGAGRSVVFDDIGEFLQAAGAEPSLSGPAFVHDARSGGWLRASEAFFVRVPALATPMGTGFAAFDSEAGARAFGGRFTAAGPPLKLAAATAAARGVNGGPR